MNIKVGQILWLKIRFNNQGDTSAVAHPYLILKEIDDETIEVGQLDKVRGKAWKLALESNKLITKDAPSETVIMEDSFIQMDNTIQLEYFDDIANFRRNTDCLSSQKLNDVLSEYDIYHDTHEIDENKQVYLSRVELENLNK